MEELLTIQDLNADSLKLKEILSEFEPHMFLGDMSFLLRSISFSNPPKSLIGLSSPQRQLYYLVGLNLTGNCKKPKKQQYSNQDWEIIKSLLIKIEKGYESFFYPKDSEEIDDFWLHKRKVSMPAFLNFFNHGNLNYDEQILDRVKKYFNPFKNQILSHFGISLNDFIDIYNYIDSLPNKFLIDKINPKPQQQTWEDFCNEMFSKNIMPNDWSPHLPEHFKNLFEFTYDKGKMFRFNKANLYEVFEKNKVDIFIELFTIEHKNTPFLFYTEPNPIYSRPLVEMKNGEYQSLDFKQLIYSIYERLSEYVKSLDLNGDIFYKVRGIALENKIEDLFKRFFRDKCEVFKSYYSQLGSEQDILITFGGYALIIEAKASKVIEPRRDPDKAYPLILNNFDEVIQKGYDQAYRIKNIFLRKEVLNIYSDQKQKRRIKDIRTKSFMKAYSIIVTQERFGQLQTDLSELLEIYENDQFPWCITIDDLEVLLLYLMKKEKAKAPQVFLDLLRIRETLHGKLISGDELEVCGAILKNKLKVKSDNIYLTTSPIDSEIFDKVYLNEGLGFENEKMLDLKTSPNYRIWGQP